MGGNIFALLFFLLLPAILCACIEVLFFSFLARRAGEWEKEGGKEWKKKIQLSASMEKRH